MKIRCKNCYRVLKDNEEYCTSCGEYSPEMAEYMRTGNKEASEGQKFKTAFILFCLIGFLGTGVLSITIAAIDGSVDNNSLFNLNSRFITSILLTIMLLIFFRKKLKNIFFNGTLMQTFGALGIGVILIATGVLLSLLTNFTKILPTYMTDYLQSSNVAFESFKEESVLRILITMILVAFCEEYICRHRLIDFLDDATMLSDIWVVIISSLVGTIISFAWMMSIETLLMTLLINIASSIIYIYTNRSLGLNILLRIILIVSVVLVNILI